MASLSLAVTPQGCGGQGVARACMCPAERVPVPWLSAPLPVLCRGRVRCWGVGGGIGHLQPSPSCAESPLTGPGDSGVPRLPKTLLPLWQPGIPFLFSLTDCTTSSPTLVLVTRAQLLTPSLTQLWSPRQYQPHHQPNSLHPTPPRKQPRA